MGPTRMNTRALTPLAFAWLLAACAPATHLSTTARSEVEATAGGAGDHEALKAHLDALERADRFHGSVAVTRPGKRPWRRALGRLGPDTDRRAEPDTRYRIGSITKTFTAAMVMQLVDEGALALDDRIARWFPGLPNAEAITIEHLLRHRSGLFDLTDAADYEAWHERPLDRATALRRLADGEPRFEPGEHSVYTNSNYVLLGYVVEDLDGRAYAESLQARVLDRLQTARTGVDDPRTDRAASMRWGPDGWAATTVTHPSVPGGAGAMVSTPAELCRFLDALFDGELVSSTSLGVMTTASDDDLGAGLVRFRYGERVAWGHTGGIDGFAASVMRFADDGTCLAITTNGSRIDLGQLRRDLLDLLHGEQVPLPSFETVTLSPEALARYEGVYRSETLSFTITLFTEGGVLFARATEQGAFPLETRTATRLVFDPADVELRFDPANGPAQRFVLHQGGAAHVFVRAE